MTVGSDATNWSYLENLGGRPRRELCMSGTSEWGDQWGFLA
jgi:hypothetical protein